MQFPTILILAFEESARAYGLLGLRIEDDDITPWDSMVEVTIASQVMRALIPI